MMLKGIEKAIKESLELLKSENLNEGKIIDIIILLENAGRELDADDTREFQRPSYRFPKYNRDTDCPKDQNTHKTHTPSSSDTPKG